MRKATTLLLLLFILIIQKPLFSQNQAGACDEQEIFSEQLLLRNQVLIDSLLQFNNELIFYREQLNHSISYIDSVNAEITGLKSQLANYRAKQSKLIPLNRELERKIQELRQELESKNQLLNRQIKKLREREALFNEKEKIYNKAINSSHIDRVKMEGELALKEAKLQSKEYEIEMLQSSIVEKEQRIQKKDSEIDQIELKKDHASRIIDTLKNNLTETEKALIKAREELKYTKKDLEECQDKYKTVTSKHKKIRVVQGFGIKSFVTPEYALSPKNAENASTYVISNQNTGNVEFDFITGASIRIMEFSDKDSKLTYDVGFFLGFGGKNLFKNFYLGPNIKLFDVVHINTGLNIRQYELLKSGFSIGDPLSTGLSIPTTNEWKMHPYLGITFDFDLIGVISKKL